MKIAVLVSGGGTNLGALIRAKIDGKLPSGELALVISSRSDAYALTRAKEAGIDTLVMSPKSYKDRREYSLALADALIKAEAELVILAGFMCVLDAAFFEHFENKVINVHPSLIPSFCGNGFYGLIPHEAAIARGVKVTGATVHFVNAETDGGPIILQKAVDIRDDDTPETLQRRVMEEAEWNLLPEAAELFCSGRLEIVGRRVFIRQN